MKIAKSPARELHQLTQIGNDRSLPISDRTAAGQALRLRRNRDDTTGPSPPALVAQAGCPQCERIRQVASHT